MFNNEGWNWNGMPYMNNQNYMRQIPHYEIVKVNG